MCKTDNDSNITKTSNEPSEKFIAIDADSINTNLRQILIKTCYKTNIKFVFVADRILKDVEYANKNGINCQMITVESGQDSADNWIFDHSSSLLLCITHDVGLSTRLAENNITSIDRWGKITDKNNYREKQSIRDLNTQMREDGIIFNKQKPMSKKDIENFANSVNNYINKYICT